ncbi:MAG TPA: alpha/beta hydrolase [Xanthobacteraceae bacterium]|nr:alpha/beta hydrolase [Xanthobacteraceae bacterium]
MDPIVWRGMTRAQLDAAYNNGAAVKNSEQKLAEWTERGTATRARRGALLDLAYGPRPRNRIDIVPCGKSGAPLFAFIHGGYWQRNSKEVFACMAEGPLAHGFDAALIGYTLAPDASLTEIVGEARTAVRWLRAKGPALGVASGKFILCGWSAGAHLTVMALADADAGLAISGLYELEPCRLNYVNEKLKLTLDEQLGLSPIRTLPASSPPLTVAFGTGELPEMQRQSRDYASARRAAKLPIEELPLSGHDHYSILEELANPDGVLTQCVATIADQIK